MVRDAQIENVLTEYGVGFSYHEAVDMSLVDVDSSRRNQARIGNPVDDDTVILYASAINAGDEFPPSVLYQRTTDGKFVHIDGNHRDEAYRVLDRTHYPAYVIEDASPNVITLLTFTLNTRHGKPTTLDERVKQGVLLVDMGATTPAAAKALGLPEIKVRDAVNAAKADRRIQALGVKGWDSLGKGIRSRLVNIRSDAVLKKAVTLAIKTKMTGDPVSEMVTEVNKFRTEAEQSKVIEAWTAKYKAEIDLTAGGVFALPNEIKYMTGVLTRLERIKPEKISSDGLTVEYRTKIYEKIMNGTIRLQQIATNIREPRG